MFAKGAHVVNAGNLGWSQELLKAVCKEVTKNGGITTYHKHYCKKNFKPTYNYNDENERFRQAGKVWSETNEKRLL